MNFPVDEIIPQKEPFVFVDKVIDFSKTEISTTFEIKYDNVFVENNKLQEAGLIENVAQTAAALEGCNAKLNNTIVKIGFIGSVKKLEVNRAPKVGEILVTKLKIITNAIGVNVAEGEVCCNKELLAKCIINIFLKED